MLLVINALGGRHTDRHTNVQMRKLKQFQETRRTWLKNACPWFKKLGSDVKLLVTLLKATLISSVNTLYHGLCMKRDLANLATNLHY